MAPQDAGRPEPTSNPPSPRPNPKPVAGRVRPPAAARAAAAATAPAVPPALNGAPDFGSLLKALRRRWLTAAVLSLLLGAAAAGAAWYFMAPEYTSVAMLKVLSNPTGFVWSASPESMAAQSSYLRTQGGALKSRRVIMHALQQDEVKRLGLDSRYPDPADWIANQMKTEFVDPSEFITITFAAPDQTDANTILKNIIAAYMDEVVYAEKTGKSERLSEVEKIYTETSNTLKRKRSNFEVDLKKVGGAVGSGDHEVLTRQQQTLLDNLHDSKQQRVQTALELVKAQFMLKALEIRQNALAKIEISTTQVEKELQLDPIAKPNLDRLPALKELVKSIQDRTSDAHHPLLVDAQAKIAELETAIEKRRGEIKEEIRKRLSDASSQDAQLNKAQLDNSVATLTESLTKLDESIKDMEGQADKIGVWNNDLEAQRGEIQRLEKVLDDIGTEKEKLTVELNSPARVSVWQNADLQKRDLKKQIIATAAAPVGALLLVCMAVAWLDVRQRRVRSAGEVASGLGIRVVGAVPGAAHLEKRLVVAADGEPDEHPALESFDAIRTQLLKDDGAEAARVLMVTSAGAGEGKTTLAAHLASSLARAGRKTLLIDGDLRRPGVHQLFELAPQPGFSEVLLAEVEAAEAVQATPQDGLSVMAAGQWDREVMQALARDGMEGVFERLREEFDFIVIDSHPVLTATDSLLLGQQVDAVILSVLRDVSQTPRVYAASQKLAALGVHVLGAVVNGADPDEVYAAAPVPIRQKAAG
ncbi:MAG TPA: polysaccharide biosynthesis tyrosine autokinase [Gemmataceae bacterium]|nr:polysaccharide biosynthesis tyrosine autokinase [Gemmataceae bacterium]